MYRVLAATRNPSEPPKMLRPGQRPLECPGGSAARGQLEEKLHCKLYKPRVANLRDLPKLRPVRNIAVRIEELRMVEDVEELSPEINVGAFGYRNGLKDRKISVAEMRPAADRTFRGSKCPQQGRLKTFELRPRTARRGGIIRRVVWEAVGGEVIVSVRLQFLG